MDLTEDQIERYARQILLKEIGGVGQKRLLRARLLCVGAGGLGCPVAIYLGAAGVGTLGVVDFDEIALSNLQRQFLHKTDQVGRPKVESVRDAIRANNPDVQVNRYGERLDASNIETILSDYDLVIDGSDNFPTRFLIADACYFLKKPLITGSVFQFEGQITTVLPGADNPCYRCLYPVPPEPGLIASCAQGGVMGAVVGTLGTMQATEAIKVVLGIGSTLLKTMMTYDALSSEWQSVTYTKDPTCCLCGPNPTIREIGMSSVDCSLSDPPIPRKEQ